MPDSPQEEKRDKYDFRGGTIEKWQIGEYLDNLINRHMTKDWAGLDDAEMHKLVKDSAAFERAVNIGRLSILRNMRTDLTFNLIEVTKEIYDKLPLSGYYH